MGALEVEVVASLARGDAAAAGVAIDVGRCQARAGRGEGRRHSVWRGPGKDEQVVERVLSRGRCSCGSDEGWESKEFIRALPRCTSKFTSE